VQVHIQLTVIAAWELNAVHPITLSLRDYQISCRSSEKAEKISRMLESLAEGLGSGMSVFDLGMAVRECISS
jgi:hypothetical protein